MAAEERWYFTQESLQCTSSRKCGVDADKELSYRQQAANFIQDMGQRLPVNQLCINTAIVYMHRFYMFHSFSKFHRNAIATCALFLAAKVEEQPRKLEHVIKVAHMCLCREGPPLDTKSEAYLEQAQQLVVNENIMLQTLGFDVAIDHPHTHIVKCCQLVRASKDLAQTSYIMATTSLHLTTMCLQYKPTVVACVCIHLACKWANWEIPYSSEGKDWFWYVDKNVTLDLLKDLTAEFLAILDKCPSRLKRKILSTSCGKDGSSSEKKLRSEVMSAGSSLLSGFPSASFSDKCGSPVHPTKNESDESSKAKQFAQQEINADQVSASVIAKIHRETGHHSRQSSSTELMRAMNGEPKTATATSSPQNVNSKRTRLDKNKSVSKEKKERSEKVASHPRIPTTTVKTSSPTTIRITKSHSDKNVRHKTKEDVNHMPAPWSNGKESKLAENKSPLQLPNDLRTTMPQILTNAETSASSQEIKKVRTLTPENTRQQQYLAATATTTPMVQSRSTKIALTNCSPYDPKTKESNIFTDVAPTSIVPTGDQSQWTPMTATSTTTSSTERRHEKKHKHKNRDKSNETLLAPRIKLTIPKERIENKDATRIKLKLSKERFATPMPMDSAMVAATSISGGGDIPKLKIKIPKTKSNDSKKREASPTNYQVSEAKIARMETRLSRKDDEQIQQQQHQLQQQQQQLLEYQQQQMMMLNDSLRHHKHKVTNLQAQQHQHYSRKNNKVANNSKANPGLYHEMQMNAGPYPYSQYYPYNTNNFYAGDCPPQTSLPQLYPRPPAFHGAVLPPPLPRDPPPPTPPPPPE